jgi:hypothetical protein
MSLTLVSVDGPGVEHGLGTAPFFFVSHVGTSDTLPLDALSDKPYFRHTMSEPQKDAVHARQKYHDNMEACVKRDFATHQIHSRSSDDPDTCTRWLLYPKSAKGWEHACWTEVIALAGGGLFVGGDIGCVVFRYGPKHPVARVRWMANTLGASDGYFREKASIGMTGKGLIRDWLPDVAIDDLKDLEAEFFEDLEEEDDEGRAKAEKTVERIRDIYEFGLDDSSDAEVHRALYDLDIYDELPGIGYVPAPRLYTAHAALQRLSSLLAAEQQLEHRLDAQHGEQSSSSRTATPGVPTRRAEEESRK